MANFNTQVLAQMGKDELRKACKNAGVSYGKLNNDGMRAALQKHYDAKHADKTYTAPAGSNSPATAEGKAVNKALAEALAKSVTDGSTPEHKAVSQLSTKEAVEKLNKQEEATTPATLPTGSGKSGGLKIEKDREEKNGVKRPSVGGQCRAVWDALDQINATGTVPTAKNVKELAVAKEWNVNNASIEYYQWRKFNGITGRLTKSKE